MKEIIMENINGCFMPSGVVLSGEEVKAKIGNDENFEKFDVNKFEKLREWVESL
jgi:hypothetical protein